MNRSQLASEALAQWTIVALRAGKRSIARQELTDIDLPSFFKAFANVDDLPGPISLALVGFGQKTETLKSMARKASVTCITEIATDMHIAASWRNKREKHPVIVAYARGMVTGVNTLRHFSGPTSSDLTLALLSFAQKYKDFSTTAAHTRLLSEMHALTEDSETFSFEQVRAFLELWSAHKGASAPRKSLPALGLLPDPNLFADLSSLRVRLEQNIDYMNSLRLRTPSQMEAVRKKLDKSFGRVESRKAEIRKRLKDYDKLQKIRRSPTLKHLSDICLDEALKVFAQLPKTSGKREDDHKIETRTLNERRLEKVFAEALLDNREQELQDNAAKLSKALRETLGGSDSIGVEDQWQSDVEVQGETRVFQAKLDRPFVAWVRHFCNVDAWGGLVEANSQDLRGALADYDRPETQLLRPENLFTMREREIGMTLLLEAWDEDLALKTESGLSFVELWNKIQELRSQLLGSLEELTHFPLEWFAGNSGARSVAQEYLKITGDLLGIVAKNFGAMAQAEPLWAKATVDGLLALDVVQVRLKQPDGKNIFKAVLLPVHPLHLWRYWRFSNLLRGIGKELSESDRTAVIHEIGNPVQFLSVIYATRLPGGRGASQVLPVANDIYRLATFENLRNAYSGPDGQDTLVYAVERFAASHRQHVNPLRLVLVNPPRAGLLLLDIIKLMDSRYNQLLPRLYVEIRGTENHVARLREALLFDTREREIIEEKVGNGRLVLSVNRQPKNLDEILAELSARPAHIVAVFDEAPVSFRRGGAGENLPMSPFCVRRKVAFHKRFNELRLEPMAGDPPFFEFIELIKHIEGNEGEGTPYAWPEADSLRKSVDSVLAPDEFGAHWFFLADRALPDDGRMVAKRLIRRREGQRQVLLVARNYESLAQLMLPVFQNDTPNLLMPPIRLMELLGEGAHLIGAGLLDLLTSRPGQVVASHVIALMGTLLTARDYIRKYPGALIVSTDSQLARSWLRLGTQNERCDLLAVREEKGKIIIECIEVKTTKFNPRQKDDTEIGKACEQVFATLAAVRGGLGDTSTSDASGQHLAAPRNEMLKEVLLQGCMSRHVTQEVRELWAGWLIRIFGIKHEIPEMIGSVVDVALGSAEETEPEKLEENGHIVQIRHLNEVDVQRLLEPQPETTKTLTQDSITSSKEKDETSHNSKEILHECIESKKDETSLSIPSIKTAQTIRDLVEPAPVNVIRNPPHTDLSWPPTQNVFGLIGQETAAKKLNNKCELASGTGRRFTDTLFIGSAGVGKSSLARAVARRLFEEAPVFFSGSDLPQPSGLIEKLREQRKVPGRARGRVLVDNCLVFIDEVHALGKNTATSLLSALDDARIATVGGVEYDFRQVVFIAATTDKGLLTDAFVSRMDIIPLADYSLAELAGIIYSHAFKLFSGFNLPREVCIEVAARCRCNPRRAVRSLENDLLAEFYSKLPAKERPKKNPEHAAAALMTVDEVAAYYDRHGIDLNGLDELGRKTLNYLKMHGASPEERLCRGLRISNRGDFVELIEYLTRLKLVNTSSSGRQITPSGRAYLLAPCNLRDRI